MTKPPNESLPPGMYKGGFRDTAGVIGLSVEYFGLKPPLDLYYPGSSTDASLIGMEGVRVIHVDELLDDEALEGFKTLGATAVKADVHSWTPTEPVDVVAFINPTGIDTHKVLDHSKLKVGGLVLWASTGLPHKLEEYNSITLKAVMGADVEGTLSVDTEDLEDYFTPKQFNELTADEAEGFKERLEHYLVQRDLTDTRTLGETYKLLQMEENCHLAVEIAFRFPHRKTGTYFIYQRNVLKS